MHIQVHYITNTLETLDDLGRMLSARPRASRPLTPSLARLAWLDVDHMNPRSRRLLVRSIYGLQLDMIKCFVSEEKVKADGLCSVPFLMQEVMMYISCVLVCIVYISPVYLQSDIYIPFN